jgi:8-oxo-dGTP pyrophosphatase MutT (NUDIX family)
VDERSGDGPVIRQVASREVYRSRWMSVREDEVEFPDGTRGTYSVVDKRDFVLVLPYEGGGFWLVEQFRYPVGSREWEFPQGGWPAGRDGTAEELAAAELREETGRRAGRLTRLGRLFAVYGYSSQSYDVFLAEDLEAGEPHREVTEQDMVHRWFAEDDVRTMIAQGRLRDAHSLAALALYDQPAGGRGGRVTTPG